MSHIKLIMSQGNKNAELEIEHSDEKQRNDIVLGLFRFFGDKATAITIPAMGITGTAANPNPQKIQPAAPPSYSTGGTVTASQQYKPEKPPLIGSERTLATPISEITGTEPAEGEQAELSHYKTGIKYKDGVPHYRLRYWCKNPKCLDKANDYILPDQMVVNCRQCGMALTVVPAAPNGRRDGFGNFFIANRPAPGAEG